MWSKLGREAPTISDRNRVQNFSDLRTASSDPKDPRRRAESFLASAVARPYSSNSTVRTSSPNSPRVYLSQQPGKPNVNRPQSPCRSSKESEEIPKRRLKKHRLRFPTAGDLRNFCVLRKRVPPEKGVREPEPLSEEELLQNMRGENGRWKQKKAEEVWMDYLALKEEEENQRILELQRQKQLKQEEAEREARMQQELIEHRKEEAKRRKRREEEEQREREKAEEKERLRKEEEERKWRARQPRPCETCQGTRKCPDCLGEGCFHALYLAPSVTRRSMQFCGRTVTGCTRCGGQPKLEKDQVKVRKGSGKCPECKGTGMITPKLDDSPASNDKRPTTPVLTGRMGRQGAGSQRKSLVKQGTMRQTEMNQTI